MKVNTGEVLLLSENIRSISGNIANAYEAVISAMNSLNNSWEGVAGERVLAKFHEMSNEEGVIRLQQKALEEYAEFLLRRVSVGYEQVEVFNTSLSDAFK